MNVNLRKPVYHPRSLSVPAVGTSWHRQFKRLEHVRMTSADHNKGKRDRKASLAWLYQDTEHSARLVGHMTRRQRDHALFTAGFRKRGNKGGLLNYTENGRGTVGQVIQALRRIAFMGRK